MTSVPSLLTLTMVTICRRNRSIPVLAVLSVAIGSALVVAPGAGALSLASSAGSGASEFTFTGVSCVTTTDCMAVGDYASGSGASLPFSEEWDGSSWSVVTTPGPAYSGLEDVSCPDATDCFAVGFSRYGTLAETWNGESWSIVPSPAPSGAISSDLAGVSCVSAVSCSAVGSYEEPVSGSASESLTLAATWNGTVWTQVPSPNPSGVAGSLLSGVACGDAASCVAVGDSFTSTGNSHTLAEVWNGTTWTLVASPNQRPGSENELTGVSCVGVTDCTAVGNYFNRSASDIPLIEKWNGSSWHLVTGANATGDLMGIACSKPTTCMAVGTSAGTFTEQERDKIWRVVPSPDPADSEHSAILVSVSCPKAFSCEAVGFYTGPSSDTTYDVTESWDGSQWKLVSSPRP